MKSVTPVSSFVPFFSLRNERTFSSFNRRLLLLPFSYLMTRWKNPFSSNLLITYRILIIQCYHKFQSRIQVMGLENSNIVSLSWV